MIPSEEHKISMFPMDFEEFLWAIGDEVSAETIRYLIKNKKAAGRYKLFNSDVGLFITLAFKDKKYTENIIYNKLLSDKLDVNLGYVYENVVAQMLIAKGNNLFYYTMKSETSNHLYEIDFLTSVKDIMCTQCQGHLVFYFPNIWTLSFMEFQDSYNEFCRIKKFVQ